MRTDQARRSMFYDPALRERSPMRFWRVSYWDLTPKGRVPVGTVFVRAATEADALERVYVHGEGLLHWRMRTGLPETFVRLTVVAAHNKFTSAERAYMAQFPEDPARRVSWPFGLRFMATEDGGVEPFKPLDESER